MDLKSPTFFIKASKAAPTGGGGTRRKFVWLLLRQQEFSSNLARRASRVHPLFRGNIQVPVRAICLHWHRLLNHLVGGLQLMADVRSDGSVVLRTSPRLRWCERTVWWTRREGHGEDGRTSKEKFQPSGEFHSVSARLVTEKCDAPVRRCYTIHGYIHY